MYLVIVLALAAALALVVPNGGQPVRDDDGRPALHLQEAVEGSLHQPLALHVQRRGGLVQQKDGGVLKGQAGEDKRQNREKLLDEVLISDETKKI